MGKRAWKSRVEAVVRAKVTGLVADVDRVADVDFVSVELVRGTPEQLLPGVLEALLLHLSIVALGVSRTGPSSRRVVPLDCLRCMGLAAVTVEECWLLDGLDSVT